MTKNVIVFDMGLSKGVIKKGQTDGVLREKHYLKVGDELFHAACVIEDTSEAQCALELVVKAKIAMDTAANLSLQSGLRLLRKFKIDSEE